MAPPIIDPPPKNTGWHNSVASFMSRRIRHIHVSGNEWYRIHRDSSSSSGGGGGGDYRWLLKLLMLGGLAWLGYQVFLWIVELMKFMAPILVILVVVYIVGKAASRR